MMNQNAGLSAVTQALATGGLPMGNRANQPAPATMSPPALSFLSSAGTESPLIKALTQTEGGQWEVPQGLAGMVNPTALGITPAFAKSVGLTPEALNSYGMLAFPETQPAA